MSSILKLNYTGKMDFRTNYKSDATTELNKYSIEIPLTEKSFKSFFKLENYAVKEVAKDDMLVMFSKNKLFERKTTERIK